MKIASGLFGLAFLLGASVPFLLAASRDAQSISVVHPLTQVSIEGADEFESDPDDLAFDADDFAFDADDFAFDADDFAFDADDFAFDADDFAFDADDFAFDEAFSWAEELAGAGAAEAYAALGWGEGEAREELEKAIEQARRYSKDARRLAKEAYERALDVRRGARARGLEAHREALKHAKDDRREVLRDAEGARRKAHEALERALEQRKSSKGRNALTSKKVQGRTFFPRPRDKERVDGRDRKDRHERSEARGLEFRLEAIERALEGRDGKGGADRKVKRSRRSVEDRVREIERRLGIAARSGSSRAYTLRTDESGRTRLEEVELPDLEDLVVHDWPSVTIPGTPRAPLAVLSGPDASDAPEVARYSISPGVSGITVVPGVGPGIAVAPRGSVYSLVVPGHHEDGSVIAIAPDGDREPLVYTVPAPGAGWHAPRGLEDVSGLVEDIRDQIRDLRSMMDRLRTDLHRSDLSEDSTIR